MINPIVITQDNGPFFMFKRYFNIDNPNDLWEVIINFQLHIVKITT